MLPHAIKPKKDVDSFTDTLNGHHQYMLTKEEHVAAMLWLYPDTSVQNLRIDRNYFNNRHKSMRFREAAAAITDEMAPDDRADLFASLPTELRSRLLGLVDEAESKDIRTLLAYPEDSAGALMTTQFVALPANLTAAQAIDLVRKNAAEMETIYQAYAVDPHQTLLGAVSLRDLVTSPAGRTIDEIMNPKIVAVNATTFTYQPPNA